MVDERNLQEDISRRLDAIEREAGFSKKAMRGMNEWTKARLSAVDGRLKRVESLVATLWSKLKIVMGTMSNTIGEFGVSISPCTT
jgi:hypothetical protein